MNTVMLRALAANHSAMLRATISQSIIRNTGIQCFSPRTNSRRWSTVRHSAVIFCLRHEYETVWINWQQTLPNPRKTTERQPVPAIEGGLAPEWIWVDLSTPVLPTIVDLCRFHEFTVVKIGLVRHKAYRLPLHWFQCCLLSVDLLALPTIFLSPNSTPNGRGDPSYSHPPLPLRLLSAAIC